MEIEKRERIKARIRLLYLCIRSRRGKGSRWATRKTTKFLRFLREEVPALTTIVRNYPIYAKKAEVGPFCWQ